jgi:hypothetical protein
MPELYGGLAILGEVREDKGARNDSREQDNIAFSPPTRPERRKIRVTLSKKPLFSSF